MGAARHRSVVASVVPLIVTICSCARVETDRRCPPPPTCEAAPKPPAFNELTCAGDCKDLVTRSMIWPDANTAASVGVDFNNDGAIDNALASIAGIFTGVTSYCESNDLPVINGNAINLLRLRATDLAGTGPARLQVVQGERTACCFSTGDYAQCQAEAQTICFDGTRTFQLDAKVDRYPPMQGMTQGGKLWLRAPRLLLRIPVPCATVATADVVLKEARVSGRWDKGAFKGQIAGVLDKSQVACVVVPVVAQGLDAALRQPFVDAKTHAVIGVLFDLDDDGRITADELACNSLIRTFLAGDVDVDGDGEMELSLGLALEAVAAVFKP